MSKTLNLPNDAQAVIKVIATDSLGAPIFLPAGGEATSSDATLFSASVDANGDIVVIAVPAAVGTGTLDYTNGALSDSATVVLAAPAAAAVSMDVADAVLSAQTAITTVVQPVTGSTVLPAA